LIFGRYTRIALSILDSVPCKYTCDLLVLLLAEEKNKLAKKLLEEFLRKLFDSDANKF
jgi:hypothetical protein